MSRRLVLPIAVLAAALAVAGCGKKPKLVDPPQGKENDVFPRVYPSPSTTDAPVSPPTPPKGVIPNLGAPNAGTSPDDQPLPFPTTGGIRFP